MGMCVCACLFTNYTPAAKKRNHFNSFDTNVDKEYHFNLNFIKTFYIKVSLLSRIWSRLCHSDDIAQHSTAHRNFIEMSNADIKVYAFLPFPPQLCCDIVNDLVDMFVKCAISSLEWACTFMYVYVNQIRIDFTFFSNVIYWERMRRTRACWTIQNMHENLWEHLDHAFHILADFLPYVSPLA